MKETNKEDTNKEEEETKEEPHSPDLRVSALSISETAETSDGEYVPEHPIKDASPDLEAPEDRPKLTYVTTRRAWAQHVADSTRLSGKAAAAEKRGKGSGK